MMIRFNLLFLVAVFLTCSWSTIGLGMHPYHVSFAEVEWNPKTGNFEIALCVWPADLEKALAKQEKNPVDLDKIENLDELLEKYVAGRFKVTSDKKSDSTEMDSDLRWIGHEKNLKKAWLYFEVSGSKRPQAWTINNRLFCELNDDQENHIQLTINEDVSNVVTGKKAAEFQTRLPSP